MRFFYSVLTFLAAPALLVHLYWRGLRNPGYRRRIGERFGLGLTAGTGPTLWVHAVSVGEVQAAAPLIRALRDEFPDQPLIVTTMTPTGAERVHDLFGDAVRHHYVPYDLAGAVRRFLDACQPRLAIIMETELWPNLYRECARRGVPLVLANARISAQSLRWYRRLGGLFAGTLAHGVVIGAQSRADAERFRELGANPERIHVTGNLKFDVALPDGVAAAGTELRHAHASGRPVWIAASTHADEEPLLFEAHRAVLERIPDALLMIVPRHPERFASVQALLKREQLEFVTRSSGADCQPSTQVFVGDTMGELPVFYAAADAAFVGGSLVPIGGHNLLEPAALGLPITTGPHNFNAPDIAGALAAGGAVAVVADADALAVEIVDLFQDPARRQRMGEAGKAVVRMNRGTLERLLGLVRPLVTRTG